MSLPFRTSLLLALVLASAPPLRAEAEGPSTRAYLETTVPVVGGDVTFTVRSPLIGASVFLSTDTTLSLSNTGSATLPVLCMTSPTLIGSGTIDATGRFQVTTASPPNGTTFYVQAIVVLGGRWHASRCATLTVGASSSASLFDGTFGLDPDAQLYSASDVEWADLDKDGCMDAIVANAGFGATPHLLMGSCGGSFTNEADSRLPDALLRPSSCVEVVDINDDSWPDLFFGGGSGGRNPRRNRIALNDGTGNFELVPLPRVGGRLSPSGICSPGGGCVGIDKGLAIDADFGDVDGDGDVDYVVSSIQDPGHLNETPDPVSLYLNEGPRKGLPASFSVSTSFTKIPGNQPGLSARVSLGDLDNDGDLDLFLATQAQNRVYVNDGAGSFTDVTATALPAVNDFSFDAEMGDFDGDGDLDVFVANSLFSNPNAIHYYENQTTTADNPIFVDASSKVPASFGPVTSIRTAAEAGDLDNDGDLDIVVGIHELPGAGGPDGETVLLINRGGAQGGTQGLFAVDPSFQPGIFIDSDVALADIDNDGDPDLYIANSGDLFQTDFHDELWINDL